MLNLLLVGNPNSGKTALFNALTHQHAKVGNWSGVTVHAESASFKLNETLVQVTDLPGLYAFTDAPSSEDEQITIKTVTESQNSILINVIDASQLERHLFLSSELLELGKPMMIVLTMTDLAQKRGVTVHSEVLSAYFQCPVIIINPYAPEAQTVFKQALAAYLQHLTPPTPLILPLSDQAKHHSLDADLFEADARYTAIHEITLKAQTKTNEASERLTTILDRIFLHRFLGLPLFFMMMYLMFFFAIHIGGLFQDFFDLTTNALFVQGSAALLQAFHSPVWLTTLISDGIGKGLNTTFTFIPVLASMFFFLSLLESSGYMARAAFVIDRLMRFLGLPGKAFVPLIIGFGCNVPAILATRTLESTRDRVMTTLIAPFMSCSARLTIYTVFVATFFPAHGQNIVFSLYVLGLCVAILTGFMLRKTILPGHLSPLILELPTYHPPKLKRLWQTTWFRLYDFLKRAATFILPICVLLSALNLIPNPFSPEPHTLLAYLGQGLTPLFSPMGLSADNWPATVGLLTGTLAKEVVIGSLNTLYSQMAHLQISDAPSHVLQTLLMGIQSIPQNLSHLGQAFLHPLQSKTVPLLPSTSLIMKQHFSESAAVYAYLIFVLLYLPCVSTMAAIKQETSSKWMWFAISWSLLMAYSLAVSYYQLATFISHPLQSLSWIFGLLCCMGLFIILLRLPMTRGTFHAIPNS